MEEKINGRSHSSNKFFAYGWGMVFLAFILAVVTQGFGIYHFSMLRASIAEAIDATGAQVGFAYSFYALAIAFTGLGIGSVLKKIGLRKTLMISAVIYSGGFILISFVNSLPMLFFCYLLLGFGNAFAGVLIITGIPSNWFVRYRGVANGIVWASTFLGSLFVTNFIAYILEVQTWQQSLVYLGCISFVVITVVAIFLKWRPQDVGMLPDGISAEEASQSLERAGGAKIVGLSVRETVKTGTFWVFVGAIFLTGVGEMGPFQNLPTFLAQIDNPMALVAMLMSFIGLAGLVAKLVTGYAIDKIGARWTFLIIEIIAAAGLVMFAMATPESSVIYLYIAVGLFGIGECAAIVCFSSSTSRFFGPKNYAQIFGLIFVAKAVGDAVGSPLIAAIAESGMGWSGAFYISAVCAVLSAVVFLFAKKVPQLTQLEEEAMKELSEERE